MNSTRPWNRLRCRDDVERLLRAGGKDVYEIAAELGSVVEPRYVSEIAKKIGVSPKRAAKIQGRALYRRNAPPRRSGAEIRADLRQQLTVILGRWHDQVTDARRKDPIT